MAGLSSDRLRKTLPLRLCQVVLVLIVAMILLSPFAQLDSWDSFPAGSDDLESQIICGLCGIGIIFVLAQILSLIPGFSRLTAGLCAASKVTRLFISSDPKDHSASLPLISPLRI